MTQSVFLAGADSLKLTRLARRDPALELIPAERAHLTAEPHAIDLPVIRDALWDVLGPPSPRNPLELTFFSREARSESRSVRARALLSRLPDNSFLEVVHSDGSPWGCAGSELRVYVEAPGLSLVRVQQSLVPPVRRGALSESAAFFRLLTFSMESCGSYARDPEDPAYGPCSFELGPLCRPEELVSFLDEASGIRGVAQARRAAALAQAGAGSPEETLLSLILRLPVELGGVEAPPFTENEPIEWPEEVRGLVEHGRMRPDFYWPDHAVAGEYNGREHVSERAFEEDQRRIRDYQTCGIAVFPASYRNVCTLPALNGYLSQLAHALAERGGPDLERRMRRAIRDEACSNMRRTFLSQTLPPLPSEKPDW